MTFTVVRPFYVVGGDGKVCRRDESLPYKSTAKRSTAVSRGPGQPGPDKWGGVYTSGGWGWCAGGMNPPQKNHPQNGLRGSAAGRAGPAPTSGRKFIPAGVRGRLAAHNERLQFASQTRSCGCLPRRGKHCSLPSFAALNCGPALATPQHPNLRWRKGRGR